MRPLVLLAVATLFAACDTSAPVAGTFDDPTYDVYHATLLASDGTPEASVTVGVAFYVNDAVDPERPCFGDGGFSGAWAADTAAVRADGAVVGGVGCGGEAVFLDLLAAPDRESPVWYRIEGSRADGRFEGTWSRGDSPEAGTVSGRLVRSATESVVVP